jgi:hypothetical protein
MAEKQKARHWKEIQTMIAIIAMTTMLAMWNTFSGVDRQKSEEKVNGKYPDESCFTRMTLANLGSNCVTQTRSS